VINILICWRSVSHLATMVDFVSCLCDSPAGARTVQLAEVHRQSAPAARRAGSVAGAAGGGHPTAALPTLATWLYILSIIDACTECLVQSGAGG
jgi:hypothetical protein